MTTVTTVTKLFIASAMAATLAISAFAYYAFLNFQAEEIREKNDDLENALDTMHELLRQKGPMRSVGSNLMAGNCLLNGNFEVPDKVQEIFGGVATIFLGDRRISTNIRKDNGDRAVGTRLVGPAHDALFVAKQPFRGETTIFGHSYLTAYDPIFDREGNVIGALFVGLQKSIFFNSMFRLKLQLLLLLLLLSTAFAVPVAILARIGNRIELNKADHMRFLQTLLDTIPCPVYYKDTAGRYLGCNKSFEACVGATRQELIGKVAMDLWPREQAERYQEKDLELLATPGIQVYEDRIRFMDGSWHNVVFNKGTFQGNDGGPGGLVGVLIDITERKTAEEETKSAHQQLFDIVEFLPDATFVIDRQQRVIAWNRAMEAMTGVRKEEMLGKGDFAYAIPFYGSRRPLLIDLFDKNLEELSSLYEMIEKNGRSLSVEVRLQPTGDRAQRHVWAIASPLLDKNGKRVGAIQTVRDITDRRRMETEKLRLKAQLRHSRIMEAVMVQLGHDLKTPLTALYVLLPLIQEQLAGSEQKRMAEICYRNILQIKDLSDKATKLAMISVAGGAGRAAKVRLAAVVENCLSGGDFSSGRSIAIENRIDGQLHVGGFADQLKELFTNLLANAVRFSPDNGTIVIGAKKGETNVTAWVRDEGVGIAAEHLPHIFDGFFKVDQSRHDTTMSGLGLTICRKVVLNHNGKIWAESDGIGKGTTIWVTLPICPESLTGKGQEDL